MSPADVITDVSTRPGKLAQSSAGVIASITIDDTLPPSTRPVIARLSAIGHVSRCSCAWRTATIRSSDSAVKGESTGEVAE